MTKALTPYDLAYHLAGMMDGDWDDEIERFVAARAKAPSAGGPLGMAVRMHITLETEEGEKQEFELFVFEKKEEAE
jgi:hypothetical protein